MRGMIKRAASVCMAALIALSFVPMAVAQEAYADDGDVGTVYVRLESGLDGTLGKRMLAFRNVMKELVSNGTIAGGDSYYDLDKDGNAEFTVETYPKSKYGPEQDFFELCDETSIEGDSWIINVPLSVRTKLRLTGKDYCSRIEISFPVLIRELNMDITAPACGTETTTPTSAGGYWDFDKQVNKPEAEVTNSDSWEWLDEIFPVWLDRDGGSNPYIGVMKGGESYYADIDLVTEYGYHFAKGVDINIDGFEITKVDVNSLFTRISGTIKASEDSHVEGDSEVIPPSVSSEGTRIYKCRGCGKVLRTEAIPNERLKNAYAEGVAAGSAFTPGRAVIKKVKAGSKKAKLTLKTVKKASGYEICLANSKTGEMKTLRVKQTAKQAKKKTIAKTVKKLKKGKYKLRVRAINEKNGETFFGAWSKIKTVKIR